MDLPNLVFVTGKGGVGKTTITRLLGRMSQKQGLRTAIIEINGETHLRQSFGITKNVFGPHPIDSGLDLFCLNAIDCLQNFGEQKLRSKRLVQLLLGHRVIETLVDGMPGLHDLFQLGKIHHLLTDNGNLEPYERIFIDTPSSGHARTLFSAASSIRDMTRVGLVHDEAKSIAETISNPLVCATVVVTFPELLPIQETISFIEEQFDEHPPVQGVILNRWVPGARLKPEIFEATRQAITDEKSNYLEHILETWQNNLISQDQYLAKLEAAIPKTLPIGRVYESYSSEEIGSLRKVEK